MRHRIDPGVTDLYPCFYGGGGSCAFDRRKFLELGGFDHLLAPFYLEDTDLGYMAWKRGWKVLYQPRSVVYHEHRGTIGKRFTEAQIQAVLKKNFILFCWKNIHEWRQAGRRTSSSLYAGALLSMVFGDAPGRAEPGRLVARVPAAAAAHRLPLARALAGRDRRYRSVPPAAGRLLPRSFRAPSQPRPDRLRVLFVSPYPICPPAHGGGVFMYQTLRELATLCEVHVVALLDHPEQLARQRESCATSAPPRNSWSAWKAAAAHLGSIVPHAVREFANDDLDWLIHRQIYTAAIDVLQLEYTPLGQYAALTADIASMLFEHDIYFQSIARGLDSHAGRWQDSLRASNICAPSATNCACCRAATACRSARGKTRDYLASFLPRHAGQVAGRPARRHRHQPLRICLARPASPTPCCSWAASGTRRTPSRWIGSPGT